MRGGPPRRLSPTDLANFLSCRHRTALDLAVALGALEEEREFDPMLERLIELGRAHEDRSVETLRHQIAPGQAIVDLRRPRDRRLSEEGAVAATIDAMRGGAAFIVQAALRTRRSETERAGQLALPLESGAEDSRAGRVEWFGYADVLRRVERPSGLGDFSYEPLDTKLARETKAGTILQLSLYCDLVAEVQGVAAAEFHVVTPLAIESYRFGDTAASYRRLRDGLVRATASDDWQALAEETYPEPVPHCEVCAWWRRCERRRRADDHLSFVAGISRSQRSELFEHDVRTLEAAAALPNPLPWRPGRGSREGYVALAQQARLQRTTREGERGAVPAVECLPPLPGVGLALLPEPAAGDVFLDFEGDPFGRPAGDGSGVATGREYLTGIFQVGGTSSGTSADRADGAPSQEGGTSPGGEGYRALWALDDASERAAFEATIDGIVERWRVDPGMHVYHFGHYEPSALKRLMGRYATRGEELDLLLRGGRFVDLHRVVRGALRAGVESYSLKELEALHGFAREVELGDARRVLRRVERFLEDGVVDIPSELRAQVEAYNRDDCLSTRALRDWLETLRAERLAAGDEIPRPAVQDAEPRSEIRELDRRIEELQTRLLDGLGDDSRFDEPVDEGDPGVERRARRLLAYLLDFHRREEKAQWWEYYRLIELGEEELLDEGDAIVGLEPKGRVGVDKRSVIERFAYPEQEVDLKAGDDLKTQDERGFGKVWAIDRVAGTVDVRGNPATLSRPPRVVFAHSAVSPKEFQISLLEQAEAWLTGTALSEAGAKLLRREAPSGSAADPLARVFSLSGEVLGIQGPPGTGKTHEGARMIVALAKAGKRVGVTAVSHKVIVNLLERVVATARDEGVALRVGRKGSAESGGSAPEIDCVDDNTELTQALASGRFQVAGATTYYWAREEARGAVDFLFVDEAGQMSLASTLAAAPAAENLVLLGDPRQLDQPKKVVHPDGVDVSALGHLIGGQATMPEERGLFLRETWRMAPPICRFTSESFYGGRLVVKEGAGLEGQALLGTDGFDGAGLFWEPVAHRGRTSSSREEIHAVARLVDRLLLAGARWIDRFGVERPLGASDVVVVAPYNAQVTRLREHLDSSATRRPEADRGVRIGTVDKFQGQEAPVVIYSMTSSSVEDAPRGLEFLLSPNRFNVATSRARCAVIVVGSPRLLDADCRTPRQLALANVLARYVELARGPV
jgi:predicted RecB family nuclease